MSPAPALPESLNLDHHLTKRVRQAAPSAMKALGKLMMDRKMLSLAGGMPHPSLFPMQHASFTLPTLESLESGDINTWISGKADTSQIHLKKTGPGTESDQGGILDLNQILQYGMSNGFSQFVEQLQELNELLHGKSIADASIYVSCGNTDGVSKVWQLFVEEGDWVLTEEYTFGSSLNSGRSRGARFFPVKTDDEGIIPSDLEATLSGWDESLGKRPHLFYVIPCGQNPTGTVMPQERYDEIYEICRKWDIIIMEDDPYFPLQYTPFVLDPAAREQALEKARSNMPPISPDDATQVAKVFNDYAGVKSFFSRDVEGRVVRIDTFSKVFGPGMRLGWVSCNSVFMERLMRIGETSTQVPNNMAQAVLASYLSPEQWGVSGFIRWMWAVRLEYQSKRDFFLTAFDKYVPSNLVTTTPCGGGMFQWLKINIPSHPRFKKTSITPPASLPLDLGSDTIADEPVSVPGLVEKRGDGERDNQEYTTNTADLVDDLWNFLVEKGVLLMPAKLFMVEKPGVDQTDRLAFFRATFAGDRDTIDKALKTFGEGVEEWFNKG